MEQKNLKTQVFIKEKIFNESAELPIDVTVSGISILVR